MLKLTKPNSGLRGSGVTLGVSGSHVPILTPDIKRKSHA